MSEWGNEFDDLLNLIPHGAIMLIDDKIVGVNETATKIFGASNKQELMGKDWTHFITHDFREKMNKILCKLRKKKKISVMLRGGIVRVSGDVITVNAMVSGKHHKGKEIILIGFYDIAKESIQNVVHNLKEMIKGLSCLYMIEKIAGKNVSLDEMFREIVNIIPMALQHAELAYSRILFREKEYRSNNYRATKWKCEEDIVINGRKEGILEIGYLKETPAEDIGPFLKEEIELLHRISIRIADIVSYREIKEEIERSKEYFHSLVEYSSDIIVVIDEEGIIQYITPSVKNAFDYMPEEVVGRKIIEFVHPQDLHIIMKKKKEILSNPNKLVSATFRICDKNGKWRIVRTTGRNLLHLPAVKGIVFNFHDITELIEKEKEARKSERLAQTALNATHDMVIVVGFDGTIFDVNESMAKNFGKSKKELIGNDVKKYLPPGIFRERFAKALEVKKSKKPIKFIDERDGKWYDQCFYPIFDENGEVKQIAAFIRDITELKKTEEALRESEERFRQVVENANEWVWEVDANGLYTYASPAIKNILGYKVEEIVGKKHFYDLFHPEDRERLKEEAFRIFESKKAFRSFINRNLHKNGMERWLITSGVPILNEEGNLIGYRGVDLDITEKKKAIDALMESEEKFRILAENSPNAIFISKEDKIVYANKKTEEITGYSREEMYSPQFNFLDLVAPEEKEKAIIYKEQLKEKGFSSCECTIIDKNGKRKSVLVNATTIPYEKGGALLCIITDITEIKKTEKEVKKLNQYLESIIENANVWLDVLDEEGNIVIWNKAAEEISGYTKEEVVGHAKIWEWLYPDEEYRKKIFSKEMAIIKEGDVVENFETEIRAKDGKKKIISWHSKNLIDEEGRPIGLVALGIDITEMKQMQEKLMEHLKMASLGRLAAVVAHELNTPLANIAITAEYLASKIGEEHEEEIRIIKEEVKNASSIIKEILSFSRMGKIEWGEIDIKNVVESAIERVKKICDTNDIIIQNRVDSHKVLGDEQRLLQCFVNIIKNAVMAKDDKKDTHYVIIDLIEREKEEEVEIKIIDNGVGMDKNVQKDAMKPFFTTRPLGEGSGLGLFIANWIIKQHGGKISIESEKGKGTEVSILLHKVKK